MMSVSRKEFHVVFDHEREAGTLYGLKLSEHRSMRS